MHSPTLSHRTTWLAIGLLLGIVGLCAPPPAAATLGSAIVVGSNDNGAEGNNLRGTLQSMGFSVDRADEVPAALEGYQSVWYVEAYEGLSSEEEDRLVGYAKGGGHLYLTGERPCCESLNGSVQNVLRRTLKDTDVQVGGMGDIDGPFAFNTDVTDHVATAPNFLVDFIPHSPGGIDGIGGVNSGNVLARSATTAVGAVWAEKHMTAGVGRIALLMDIDWLNDPERVPIIENLANFLTRGGLCSNEGAHGLSWKAGPENCSAINTPATVTWRVEADAGSAPALDVSAKQADANCSTSAAGRVATATCVFTGAEPVGATVRVTATGAGGSVSRHYRIRPKNDPRNVPPGWALDSNWWDWPDKDGDGLPDHWETSGVWVKNTFLDLPGRGALPDRKDLFLYYEFQEGEEQTDTTLNTMKAMFSASPLSGGARLHIQRGASIPSSIVGDFSLSVPDIVRVATYSGFLRSPEYGGTGVPPIYKWMLNFSATDASKRRLCGSPARKSDGCGGVKRGFAWTATGVSGFDAALKVNLPAWDSAARENARAFVEAANANHELGHLLGLLHHGAESEPADDAGYKSIMSYAYSHFGLPGDGLLALPYLDYSRSSRPNLDWRMGTGVGALTFVSGQHGETPDFYANSSEDELPALGEAPVELTEEEKIAAALPDSVRSFIRAYDIPASPSIPTLADADAVVSAGEVVEIPLAGRDPGGAAVSYTVSSAPALGTARPTSTGLHYTAAPGVQGTDVFTVRAGNGALSSDHATVRVTVTPSPAGEPPNAQPFTPASPGGLPASPARKALKLTGSRVTAKGRRVTFHVRLSVPARVQLLAERKVGRRYRRVRATKPKVLPAGVRSVSLTVPKPGTYRMTLKGTADGAGAASVRRVVRVRGK